MSRDFSKKYNYKEEAKRLIREIKEDTLRVGVPNYTQEDIDNVKPHAVVWNLFHGNYKFSSREFEEILNILNNKNEKNTI